jgi:hypothetical protein
MTGRERIRALNDRFRQSGSGGRVMITAGVAALGESAVQEALAAVRAFAAFGPDNDPHGEHDFGSFEVGGRRLFWKIDYYDAALAAGSPDPSDPAVTTRVLTVMLVEEY